jgi:hypothetical protein
MNTRKGQSAWRHDNSVECAKRLRLAAELSEEIGLPFSFPEKRRLCVHDSRDGRLVADFDAGYFHASTY